MNPRARLQDPITVDDVLASPMEASPLHKLDCCLVTDGAGAVVLTSAERARALAQAAGVRARGRHRSHPRHDQPDAGPHRRPAGWSPGREAFRTAGLAPADVDVVELYDSFTITVLLALEDLGFCAKGEGGAFVADGPLRPGGALPANTNGGGLAYTHPGSVRHVPAGRGGPPAPRRGRRPPGARAPRWPWPTAAAACSRPCPPSSSARRRRSDGPRHPSRAQPPARVRGRRPVLGRHPGPVPGAALVPEPARRRTGTRGASARPACPRSSSGGGPTAPAWSRPPRSNPSPRSGPWPSGSPTRWPSSTSTTASA